MDWQPIATAPKDGSHILAYQPSESVKFDHDYCVVWWCEYANDWRDYGDIGACGQDGFEPTHWAPLKPPAQ